LERLKPGRLRPRHPGASVEFPGLSMIKFRIVAVERREGFFALTRS